MATNNYVLGKRIARGGMAEIYLGKAVGEAAFQRICAIKRILPHYSQDREFIEMFRDEAHICKRLQHANIVQVYDFTEVEGSYALIMEHVDGGDLRSLLSACEIARSRIPVPMSLYIAANVARGLHYAHTKADEITNEPLGIVHRDVSPQNILISFEGEVKITDFGIASAENKITETRPGVVKGKYSYMSPEQVAAKPLDGRSDVFSTAIVLWECLAMKRLFAGQTEVESIRKVQNCEIGFDLRQLNSQVDDDLYRIVMKGLARERKNRYQTSAAFEKDLLRYLHSRYSDFTSSELGNFVKRILAKKRDKTQDDIKQTLSQLAAERKASPTEINLNLNQQPQAIAQEQAPAAAQPPQQQAVAQSDVSVHSSQPGEMIKIEADPSYNFQSINRTSSSRIGQIGGHPSMPRNRPLPRGTNANRTAFPQPQYRKTRPNRRGSGRFGMILLGLLVLAAGGYWLNQFIADDKLHVRLESVPDTVRIQVNEKYIEEGYTKTPAKISLKPGQYVLELSRPGYQSEKVSVQGDKRQTITVPKLFLKRLPVNILRPLRILSPDKKLFINVDNGLYRGSTPMRVELQPNRRHSISFYWGDQQKSLKCSFVMRQTNSTEPQTLTIRTLSNGRVRCSIRN